VNIVFKEVKMNRKEIRKEAGIRFKKMREALKVSQGELSARLGVGRASYAKYERGDAFPPLDSLMVLVKTFDLSLDWLISGRGPMLYKEKEQPEKITALEDVMKDVKDLLVHMERIPLLRYKVLSFFQEFKLEYKELVESSMADV